MQRIFSIILFALGASSACAEIVSEAKLSQQDFVVSEFEKFVELELRDCISATDAVLHQARGEETSLKSEDEKLVRYMLRALSNKVGEVVALQDVRETSSFHVSGIYLGGDGGVDHLEYQERIIEACNAQIHRIVRQVAERAASQ